MKTYTVTLTRTVDGTITKQRHFQLLIAAIRYAAKINTPLLRAKGFSVDLWQQFGQDANERHIATLQ